MQIIKNKVKALYLGFIGNLIFYSKDKLLSYINFPLQKYDRNIDINYKIINTK